MQQNETKLHSTLLGMAGLYKALWRYPMECGARWLSATVGLALARGIRAARDSQLILPDEPTAS